MISGLVGSAVVSFSSQNSSYTCKHVYSHFQSVTAVRKWLHKILAWFTMLSEVHFICSGEQSGTSIYCQKIIFTCYCVPVLSKSKEYQHQWCYV